MNGIHNRRTRPPPAIPPVALTITLTFQSGTDPDIAQVQVQNKLQLATPVAAAGGSAAGDQRQVQ
ncbi:hypothetical protein ACNKHV_20600 [Shigella flexneri]